MHASSRACHVAGNRHHQRPPVPHGLRGRAGEPPVAARPRSRSAHRAGCAARSARSATRRLTVMAALTVADELADTGGKLRRLEEDLADAAGRARGLRRAGRSHPGRGRRGAQLRRRAHRAGDQGAQSQPRRRRHVIGMRRRARTRPTSQNRFANRARSIGLPGGAGRVIALHWRGGAAGCVRSISPGPYRSHGSCPCPGSWVRAHGAHLHV